MSVGIRCPKCGSPLVPGAGCARCPGNVTATQSLPDDGPLAPGPRSTPRADADGTGPRPRAADTAPEPELPERIGRFVVRGFVGEGSFAEVYQAHDPQLDREVALKVARPGTLGTARRVKRFLREAKAAGNLRHPNIVPIHETGEDGGRHFLVTAFIRGTTLGARVEAAGGGGLPLEEAARLVRKLAEALAYAHGEGIVHRDVKPENVMLDDKGEPLLMDFGLATRAEPDEGAERLTQQGIAVGTPAYMAPEQAQADLSATVGPAADQYALGCVLFELLTGRTPFSGPAEIQLLLHQTQPAPSPRKLRPEVPRDLETICLKCLEKEPGKRYADCGAVADELRRWLDGEPISARRPDLGEQLVRWVKRNPGRAVAVLGVILVVVGAVAAGFWFQQSLADQRVQAEAKRLDDLRAADEAAREQQRQTRAESLVDALATADTAAVPRIVADLAPVRELARPKLVELAKQRMTTKPGLHARLALLPDEPKRVQELASVIPGCQPDQLLTIRSALKPYSPDVAPSLWMILLDPNTPGGGFASSVHAHERVLDRDSRIKIQIRCAAALAGLNPEDARWAEVMPVVVDATVRSNPGEFVVWAQALEPVRARLLPALMTRYTESRAKIESGRLAVTDLAAEATAFDLTANLLARYTTDRPSELAELAMTVDGRHLPLFFDAIQAQSGVVADRLEAEIDTTVAQRHERSMSAVAGGTVGFLATNGWTTTTSGRSFTYDPNPYQERWRKVLAATDDKLKDDPKNVAALEERGDALYWLGEDDEALKAVTQVLDANPKRVVALSSRCLLHVRKGDHKAALTDLEAFRTEQTKLYKESGKTWREWITATVQLAEPDAAEDLGEKALKSGDLDARHAAAAYSLASVPVLRRDPAKGRTYQDKAVKILAEGGLPAAQLAADQNFHPLQNHPGFVELLTGRTSTITIPPADGLVEALAKRQASAAVVLLRLSRPEKVWPLLKHSPDPRVRSYLIHRLFPLGADPVAIVQRLDAEPDLSARRALLLALGEFDEATLPAASRTAVLPKVQSLYRDDPDPGLHAAAEWLLRQWKQDAWLARVNAEWAKDAEQRDKRLAGIAKAIEQDGAKAPARWYVNGQGQTYTVIPGPVEFRMGSPPTEKDRHDYEVPHTRRIGRSFAIANKSVTVREYRRFNPSYTFTERYAPEPDCPVVSLNWYQAAAYCNWLSEQEHIPEDQWVYEITRPQAVKLKANYLSRTGYRLPTEAEMEYATRAKAPTSRYYGETEELLGQYAWYSKNSSERTWSVGRKKPNELGLFDSQGNCYTWCQESYKAYASDGVVEDREDALVINSTDTRVLRGGAFTDRPSYVRSADRAYGVPSVRNFNLGVRPARTFTH